MMVSVKHVPIRARWINARAERDFGLVDELGELLLSRPLADDLVLRSMARLHDRQGREQEAIGLWKRLSGANPDDFEAAFNVARAKMSGGIGSEQAVAEVASLANDIFQQAMIDALEGPAPVLEGPFRHVAICGVAYCGSTVLDRVLGGLPGVKSIGESHWLTKCRADNAYRDVDMSVPINEVIFVPCTVCGHRCEVLTRDFRRSLAADSSNWYRKVAYQLGTSILVSADKNVPKLLDKDPLLELSALVVFKSPEQAWKSKLDKLPADRPDSFYIEECRKYLKVWASSYRGYLDHFRPQGPVVFLNFDAFTGTPEPLLRAACNALALPFDPTVLQRTVPGHAIGGNGRAMRRLRDKDYGVAIEPLPTPDLPAEHMAIVAGDAEVQRTWADLMARHQQLNTGASASIEARCAS